MTRARAWLLCGVVSIVAACVSVEGSPQPADGGAGRELQQPFPPPFPPPPPGGDARPPGAGDLATGSASCVEISVCEAVKMCKQGELACEQGCVATGTAAAQSAFLAMRSCEDGAVKAGCAGSCGGSAVGSEACVQCLETSCSASYGGCGLAGTCAQAMSCAQACKQGDATCGGACIGKLTPLQRFRFLALETCAKEALAGACKSSCATPQSPACESCAKPKCTTQAKACGLI